MGQVLVLKKQMKEIHDDIVPFGFIDDGAEQIKKIEIDDNDHPWAIGYDKNL